MSKKKNRKRRVNRVSQITAVVTVLIFCGAASIPVLLTAAQRAQQAKQAPAVQPAEQDSGTSHADLEMADLVAPVITLAPEPTPEPTAVPTPEPTPTPTVEPTPEPTPTPFAYLPVVYRANTDQKRIAVTVDDCYQKDNLKTIVDLAVKNGAKLTLFPVGENLKLSGMPEIMQRCAFELGFEIENHTYSHARIFRLPEEEMAAEIWNQHQALNQALGVDYSQHFLRLMGGDGETDQRTHNYLQQLGYYGIAKWSVSGSDSEMEQIKNSLSPGQVYLFHTTDADTAKLKKFIPWAVSQGYELVTMNELLGLPDNETALLTQQSMPVPASYTLDRHTEKLGDYTWVVLQLQEALRRQGYLVMDGPSTGYYGKKTAKAVSDFQAAHGLTVSGEADGETQDLILANG